MIKKLIAVFLISFLLFFSYGCGSSDSTSSSSNLAPGASFINDFNSAVGDLGFDASESNFDGEWYGDIFGLDSGIVSKFSYYLDLYTAFRNSAEYNSEEERWEAVLEGGEIVIYGSFVEDAFYVRSPDIDGLSIYYYPDEESFTINIVGTPDSLDPSFRAELV